MMNPFRKFLLALRKSFPPLSGAESNTPANPPSAEGWEFVDGFNDQPTHEISMLQVSSGIVGKPPKHIPDVLESSLPPYPVVWAYFLSRQYPDTEAENFYNRFQLVYWKSFGIKPIENWKQLADRWMLRQTLGAKCKSPNKNNTD